MSILSKYTISSKPPKLSTPRTGKNPMEKVNRTFLAGLEKQLKQAKTWKPGAKESRSWVTRDEAKNQAWVTVKYGPWPVPLKGNTKTTLGPVKIENVPSVFEDVRKAHAAGELDAGLKKIAFKGPRRRRGLNRSEYQQLSRACADRWDALNSVTTA